MTTRMNTVKNCDFSEGLNNWNYSDGVSVSGDPLKPGVILPGTEQISQWLGDVTVTDGIYHSSGDLSFLCYRLESTGIRLQVRIDYTDGSHQTHANLEFSMNGEIDEETGEFTPATDPPESYFITVPINGDLHVKRFTITNMDMHSNAAVILYSFLIFGEDNLATEPGPEPMGPEPYYMKSMKAFDARMMARFNDLENKLNAMQKKLAGPEKENHPKP